MRVEKFCMGCNKRYVNNAIMRKHGARCIKKQKWLLDQKMISQEEYNRNVKYITEKGYKQN